MENPFLKHRPKGEVTEEEKKVFDAFNRVKGIRSPGTEFHHDVPPDEEPYWLKED